VVSICGEKHWLWRASGQFRARRSPAEPAQRQGRQAADAQPTECLEPYGSGRSYFASSIARTRGLTTAPKFPPTNTKARADYEALQVTPAPSALRLDPGPDRQSISHSSARHFFEPSSQLGAAAMQMWSEIAQLARSAWAMRQSGSSRRLVPRFAR
jgi:hypothetical protein